MDEAVAPWWQTPNGKFKLKCVAILVTIAGYVGIAGMPFLAFNTVNQENSLMSGDIHLRFTMFHAG